MFQKFESMALMELYFPSGDFMPWPDDTYSFCPKCAFDSFEKLYDSGSERFFRCAICGSLWVAGGGVQQNSLWSIRQKRIQSVQI